MLHFQRTVQETVTVRVYGSVLSWLADANGEPVTATNVANAAFIKTAMFMDDDGDYDNGGHAYIEFCERYPDALFVSFQEDGGESLI